MTATAPALSEKAVRAALELKRRREENALSYFEPASPEQEAVLKCEKKGALVLGGNRGGKTVIGAVETCFRATKSHPFKKTHKGKLKIWCCSQLLPGVTDKPHVQLEEIRRWLPKDALRGGAWEKAYSPAARTLTLADGTIFEFKSYDQGLLQFESAKVHFVWFDEEPPDYQIFQSCLLRLLDFRGQWMMTLTPVLSLQGKGWVEQKLYGRRTEDVCEFDTYQLSTLKNRYLDPDEVHAVQGSLSDEEAAVRLNGAFARIGGRVLSELRHDIHRIPGFLPPPSWQHYLIIDPGFRNATAALFAAADPEGDLYLYNEHYVKEELPLYHLTALDALHQAHGSPPIQVLMDPASWARVGTVLGRSDRTVVEEYEEAKKAIQAKWFRPSPAINEEKGVWKIKRYLQPAPHRKGPPRPKLYICDHLTYWWWEAERWSWPVERNGLNSAEHPLPERPVDKDNHLMDCLKYLTNQRPEPVEFQSPAKPRDWSDILAKHLAAKVKAVQGWKSKSH